MKEFNSKKKPKKTTGKNKGKKTSSRIEKGVGVTQEKNGRRTKIKKDN